MYQVVCPQCGYVVGIGTWSDPGTCPSCEVPLMLTAEMRALTPDDARNRRERRAGAEAEARW
jgi:hypothetical protein